MWGSTYAQKQADTACEAASDQVGARIQHANDRMKKHEQKQRKATKEDKVEEEPQKPLSKKELAALLAAATERVQEEEQWERNARQKIVDSEREQRSWYLSWARDTFRRQLDIEKARRCRGMVPHSAVRRLTRELAIVNRDPAWGVSAQLVSDNILLWHCNVAAPGGATGKGVLHIELKFPNEYPAVPPKVRTLGADIQHPNVFGDYICLDMLQAEGSESLTPFTGWSAAYGVQRILLQLQSFFYSMGTNIKITPHSSNAVWEYQLAYSDVTSWRDWAWDEHSFCGHAYAQPGRCPRPWCDGMGKFTRKWVPMHPQDQAQLEAEYKARREAIEEYKASGTRPDALACFGMDDMVFARRLKGPQQRIHVTIRFASGLQHNGASYEKEAQYGGKAYYTWAPYVVVREAGKEAVLYTTDAAAVKVVNRNVFPKQERTDVARDDLPFLPKTAGASTPVWMETFEVPINSHTRDVGLEFEVYDGGRGVPEFLGKVSTSLPKQADAAFGDVLTLGPDMKTGRGVKKVSGKGSLGKLAISVEPPKAAKARRAYKYNLTPVGPDGHFAQTSVHNKTVRTVRRRNGFVCKDCGHTAAKPCPELPSVVDCDDAPTYALDAFFKSLKDAIPDEPEARRAVQRSVDSMKEEVAAKRNAKNRPSNIMLLPHDCVLKMMDYLPRMRERRYIARMLPSWTVCYRDARYWEAQHLRCFTTGAGPADDVLGVGVLAGEAMHGRPVFTCQFDAVSYTAYKEGVRLGVWKEKFTHWIPLFIDEEHAGRAMAQLLPMMNRLSVGVRSTNSAWTVVGGEIDGKGKNHLKRVANEQGRHIFKSTAWAGLRGGSFCASGKHYFQVEVLEYDFIDTYKVAGCMAATGVVKIGWVTQNGDVNLGTDGQGFCYSTPGFKVHDAERTDYGPRIVPGDVIGTLWDADAREIRYFRNGEPLGVAFQVPSGGTFPGLIPCVALNRATVEVDIQGGYDAPCAVNTSTLGAHTRSVDRSIGQVIAVLPQLMNHMVVEVMNGKLHASVKALQGYCALHRLFLYCCDTIAGLQDTVERNLSQFINHPAERHKVICPDLGVVLCLLTVSKKFWWEDLRNAFLQELFTRHVRWSIKKSKRYQASLLHPYRANEGHFADEAFFANETSCKLVIFQVFFSNMVKPPREDLRQGRGYAFAASANTDAATAAEPAPDADAAAEKKKKKKKKNKKKNKNASNYTEPSTAARVEINPDSFDNAFEDVKWLYDSRMGFPTDEMTELLVGKIKSLDMDLWKRRWNALLVNVGAQERSTQDMVKRLKDAYSRSAHSGYHADCAWIDRSYAARVLRMRPFERYAPGEKPKPKPKPKWQREWLPEDDYDGAGWGDHADDLAGNY